MSQTESSAEKKPAESRATAPEQASRPEEVVRDDERSGQAETQPTPAAPEVAQLEAQIKELESKVADYWDQLLRARAEVENSQRRAAREVDNARKFALERFAQELLPVKDSLEMGLRAAKEGQADLAKVIEGLEMTGNMLATVMEKFKISEINPLNEKFNPDLHEAMSVQPSTEHEPNTVLTVYQKGYMLHDRLIRPAMVVVSKADEGGKGPEEGKKIDETA